MCKNEYIIMNKNRIKHLFDDFELRLLSWSVITNRIRKNMGSRFHCNRIETDWITEEKNKPTKDTLDLMEIISENKVKVVKLK